MNYNQKLANNLNLLNQINHLDLSGNKEGYVKIYPNNSRTHEEVKFLVSLKLKILGFEIYTEVRIKNHRADIVAVKEGIGYIIEIINSEKQESIEKKLDELPLDFEVITIKADEFKFEEFEI